MVKYCRLTLVTLCLWAACQAQSQEVYKWVDSKGKVHYSDQAPSETPVERIDIPPGPDAMLTEEARIREQRIKATGDKLGKARTEREAVVKERMDALREQQEKEEERELRRQEQQQQQYWGRRWYYGPGIYPRPPYWPPVYPPVQLPGRPIARPSPSLKPAPVSQ